MVKLKLSLNFPLSEQEKRGIQRDIQQGEHIQTPQEKTFNVISLGVASYYERGLEGQLRRLYGRIQRKLETAVDEGKEEVELEEAEFDFIKKAVENGRFVPAISKFVEVVEDELDLISKSL